MSLYPPIPVTIVERVTSREIHTMCICPPTTEIWINCNPSALSISFKSGNLESLNRGAHHQEAGVVWWWVREMRIATCWCGAGWPRLGESGSASTVAWRPPSTRCTPTLRPTMSPSPLSASSAWESARQETHCYSIGLATTKDSEKYHCLPCFAIKNKHLIAVFVSIQHSLSRWPGCANCWANSEEMWWEWANNMGVSQLWIHKQEALQCEGTCEG